MSSISFHARPWSSLPLATLLLALAAAVLGGCDPDAAEKQAVRAAFDAVNAADDGGDAAAYASHLTQRSFPYYDRLLQVANTAGSAEIVGLPAIERWQILAFRHRIPLEERRRLDGRALLAKVISERWYRDEPGDESVLRLGEIRVNGAYARARIIFEGERTPFWLEFIRENDYGQADPTAPWKFDEPTYDPFWNDRVARWAREEGMSEDEFLVAAEELDTGREVRRDIWDRP